MSSQVVQATGSERFVFRYISNDGSIHLDCAHVPIRMEPDDYRVTCGKGTHILKTFDVRFKVRPVRNQPPGYEIVFWISSLNQQQNRNEGSTAWLGLNKGAITDLALHQEVENGFATLVVYYSAGL